MSERRPFGKSYRDTRALRAAFIQEHGREPTPKQLRRLRRQLTELVREAASRATELPRTDVLKGDGRAA